MPSCKKSLVLVFVLFSCLAMPMVQPNVEQAEEKSEGKLTTLQILTPVVMGFASGWLLGKLVKGDISIDYAGPDLLIPPGLIIGSVSAMIPPLELANYVLYKAIANDADARTETSRSDDAVLKAGLMRDIDIAACLAGVAWGMKP